MLNKRFLGRYDGEKLWGLRLIKYLLVFIAVLAILLIFVVGVTHVSGDSMHPTLQNNGIVIFNRLTKSYIPGDIVAIKMANGDKYVKRVIAVEGDTVQIKNGKVLINNVEENYSTVPDSTGIQSIDEYPLKIEKGQYFVLGDNREKSIDSRSFGPIAISQIQGKVLFVK